MPTKDQHMTISITAPGDFCDGDLVQRAQRGDIEAFAQIYDATVHMIFRFVYAKVGDRHLAEDLTSDTYCRALKSLRQYTDQGKSILHWLFVIAGRLILDHLKRHSTKLSAPVADIHPMLTRRGMGVAPVEQQPEPAVVEHLANVELLEHVQALPQTMSDCLTLRYLAGLSIAETAKIMGKTESEIKQITYRAVRRVRREAPHLARTAASN